MGLITYVAGFVVSSRICEKSLTNVCLWVEKQTKRKPDLDDWQKLSDEKQAQSI